jgi:hypothetical protein
MKSLKQLLEKSGIICISTPTPSLQLTQDGIKKFHTLITVSRQARDSIFPHLHCAENPIYEFSEKELCGLSPNSCIHVSVSDLYIPRIGPHIWLQQNRQTHNGNIYFSHRYMSVGIGRQNIIILF